MTMPSANTEQQKLSHTADGTAHPLWGKGEQVWQSMKLKHHMTYQSQY